MAQVVGIVGNTVSEPIKNICAIVEERDKLILEKDIKIKYYKNALEKVLDETKNLEKERRKMTDADHSLTKQLEQLEFIKTSLAVSQEVARESLLNHQFLEEILVKEIETKEQENQFVEQECRNLYSETLQTFKQNPFFCELEDQKVEFLKLDIQRRDLEVKIRQKKANEARKLEIQKKIFYNFFVEMAESYLIAQKVKELEILKIEESEALRRFFAVQEQIKSKQKLGTSREKLTRMANITFGSQEPRKENARTKLELPQEKNEPKAFNEKLSTMFQQNESKKIVVPTKIQILNQKILIPAFVPPSYVPLEKRKNKIDLSHKWQKRMKKSRDSIKGQILSQDSDKQSSQASQQPETSQSFEESMIEVPVTETSSVENAIAHQLTPSQENHRTSIQRHDRVPLIQYQLVEHMNVGNERFRPEKSHAMVGMPANKCYETDKHYKTSVQITDVNKSMMSLQENQQVSIQNRENISPVESQIAENVNIGAEGSEVDNLQMKNCATALQGNLAPSGVMLQTRPSANSDVPCIKPSIISSQWEKVPKAVVSEPTKSVRFNLEPANPQNETKSMFGRQSIFGNMFNPFANQAASQNESLAQGLEIGKNNSSFNVSLMDRTGENSHIASNYYPGRSEVPLRSPEYSYEVDENGRPDMQPFGRGGGFFSFAKNQFNPF